MKNQEAAREKRTGRSPISIHGFAAAKGGARWYDGALGEAKGCRGSSGLAALSAFSLISALNLGAINDQRSVPSPPRQQGVGSGGKQSEGRMPQASRYDGAPPSLKLRRTRSEIAIHHRSDFSGIFHPLPPASGGFRRDFFAWAFFDIEAVSFQRSAVSSRRSGIGGTNGASRWAVPSGEVAGLGFGRARPRGARPSIVGRFQDGEEDKEARERSGQRPRRGCIFDSPPGGRIGQLGPFPNHANLQ